MKKGKGLFVLLPVLLLSLTACDLSGLLSNLGNDDSEESSQNDGDNSSGNVNSSADDSIFDKPESLKKLMAFGKNTGFELKTKATEDDAEGAEITLGMKGNVWWTLDADGSGTGYRLENNVCSMLSYNSETQSWSVLIANAGETQYEEMFESVSSYFYTANNYFANEGFAANGSGTYAGRNVLKYKYERSVATVSVKHEYYVDKDLGITLYQYAETVSDGQKDWAKVETVSFKTGNDVTAITVA